MFIFNLRMDSKMKKLLIGICLFLSANLLQAASPTYSEPSTNGGPNYAVNVRTICQNGYEFIIVTTWNGVAVLQVRDSNGNFRYCDK